MEFKKNELILYLDNVLFTVEKLFVSMFLQSLQFISEASLEGKLIVPQQYYFQFPKLTGTLALFCFPHCLIWLTPGLRYLVQRNFDTINYVLNAQRQAKGKASITIS